MYGSSGINVTVMEKSEDNLCKLYFSSILKALNFFSN